MVCHYSRWIIYFGVNFYFLCIGGEGDAKIVFSYNLFLQDWSRDITFVILEEFRPITYVFDTFIMMKNSTIH